MIQLKLSDRMQLAADMITPGHCVADIGTDHGFLPIYLMMEKKCPSVLAMDLRPGPLSRAGEHIREYGLEDKITLRLSDGLAKLEPEDGIDTVVIMGMGGRLVARILEQGKEKLKNISELILGPQSDLTYFREFLGEIGFRIQEERMVCEEEKYYVLIKAVPGQDKELSPVEKRFGACLLHRKDPVLHSYLHREWKIKKDILDKLKEAGRGSDNLTERIGEVERKLALIRGALQEYGEEE